MSTNCVKCVEEKRSIGLHCYKCRFEDPVKLLFDPENVGEEIAEIFASRGARTFWLLWKSTHITSEGFNGKAIEVGKMIDESNPEDEASVKEVFQALGVQIAFDAYADFSVSDIGKFSEWAWPYFVEGSGQEVRYTSQKEQKIGDDE